jgi:ubiquitin
MREYIKKKKIDSLDLKYIVPKRLAIHRAKESSSKKEKVKLPPISPSISNKNTLPKTKTSRLELIQPNEARLFSKEKKKGHTEISV